MVTERINVPLQAAPEVTLTVDAFLGPGIEPFTDMAHAQAVAVGAIAV